MYKLVTLQEARDDKKRIMDYIRREYHFPSYAKRLSGEFVKSFSRIKSMPYSCPVLQTEVPTEREFRKLIVREYIVLYWVDEEKRQITVARIFHGKQDYMSKI
jgi:plasmid stabilization system protein ParE